MIAPTTKFGFKILSPKIMSLRSMIGMLILVNMALAMELQDPNLGPWTLVAQKALYHNKDSSLSTIKISYNAKGNNEFRLVGKISKRFYFSKEKNRDQQNAYLNLTEANLDKLNNCVTLGMRACSKFTRVCDRRIFYLEQDGPDFMRFLIQHNKIRGLTMQDHFKRHTFGDVQGEHTICYTVTLMKDDWKNKMVSGIVSMHQTSQLRVIMNANNTVRHFELAQRVKTVPGEYQKFNIKDITTYDEENNRVLLKLRKADVSRDRRFSSFTVNRWLYLGVNTDSKKFLLFLMEMFHIALTGNATVKFSKATAASLPTVFQGQDPKAQAWRVVAEQYVEERREVLSENATRFFDQLPANGGSQNIRRRLAEVAYRSFIGFNMLLVCCLLVGISFAYHIGTQEANYEAIHR